MQSSSRTELALVLSLSVSASGCATTRPIAPVPSAPAIASHAYSLPGQYYQPEARLTGDTRPTLGLALSGGGVRSAMFSLGVLKGLYDTGLLRKIDAVSTVSGGGYTGYWLFANEYRHPSPRTHFGEYSLSDSNFPIRLCEILTTANFVPYAPGIGSLFSRRPSESVDRYYERSLQRSFGRAEAGGEPMPISALSRSVATKRMPFLIMNATVADVRSYPSWSSRLMEFTPAGRGNADYGYRPWSTDQRDGLSVNRIAAISGAAQAPLRQILATPYDNPPTPEVPLWDGGRSENLGAMALFRRGTRHTLIFDAEYDERYRFGAYHKLRDNLAPYGGKLFSQDIENAVPSRAPRFATTVFDGSFASPQTGRLSFDYVKMAEGDWVRRRYDSNRAEGSPGGLADWRYQRALQATGREWDCGKLRASPMPMANWSAHVAAGYGDWLNKRSIKARLVNALGIAGSGLRFPQYSTMDQSFYIDQAKAYVGLGYLQALELHDRRKRRAASEPAD